MTARQMKLGLSMRYQGYHTGSWRHPEVQADAASDYRRFLEVTQAAERGKFDMVFLADSVGIRSDDIPPGSLARNKQNVELEPLTLLAALAPMTSRIGLVATASTTYNEPYHIARKFASLDQISEGRSGWNVVTSWSDMEAKNFNRGEHLNYDDRYERAAEFVDVVTGLWESWDADAFTHDKESGVFYDETRMHVLNHAGKHFSVRGPLNVRRSPQGRPILVQAGTSEVGQEIAARHCDVVFSAAQDIGVAQGYYKSVKGRLSKYGRAEQQLVIMPGLTITVAPTRKEAREKHEELARLVDPLVGLSLLTRILGDLSHLPLDGPLPEPDFDKLKMRSTAKSYWDAAQAEGLTIRQLCQRAGMTSVHRTVVGTPAEVADAMQEWFENGAADGFNITPTHLPHGIDDFVELVLPELQDRGLVRVDYEGSTLRENLGLS